MGVRSWFLSVLSRGEELEQDPEAQIELEVVPLARGPTLVAELQYEGIDAVGLESFGVVTDTSSKMRIMVRRSDVARAREILDRVL